MVHPTTVDIVDNHHNMKHVVPIEEHHYGDPTNSSSQNSSAPPRKHNNPMRRRMTFSYHPIDARNHPDDSNSSACSSSSQQLHLDDDSHNHQSTTDSVLIQAMMELQHELRIKHEEVYVLQQTIHNLSHVIQESDQHIEHLQMHNEQLQFKLQMLTFVDPTDNDEDDDNNDDDDTPVVDSTKQRSVRVHPWDMYGENQPHHDLRLNATNIVNDAMPNTLPTTTATPPVIPHDTATSMIMMKIEPKPQQQLLRRSASLSSLQSPPLMKQSSSTSPPRPESFRTRGMTKSRNRNSTPVSVDDGIDDDDNDDDDDSDENDTSTTSSEASSSRIGRSDEEKKDDDFLPKVATMNNRPNFGSGTGTTTGGTIVIGPSQAHFYHVIQERDYYKTKYQKIMNELHVTQKKLYTTQYKLRSSNTLLELSYNNNSGDAAAAAASTTSSNRYSNQNRKTSKIKPSKSMVVSPTSTITKGSASESLAAPLDSKTAPIPSNHKEPSSSSSLPPAAVPTTTCKSTHSPNEDARHRTVEVSSASIPPTERPKIPSLPWRRNHGIASHQNTNRMEKDTLLLQVSECVSYISDDEMIHKHWNASSDKAADAISTDQYIDALLSCTLDNQNSTSTKVSSKTTATAIDTDNNRFYVQNKNDKHHHQNNNNPTSNSSHDDADRGAGGDSTPTAKKPMTTTITSRIADSILFDI